MDSGLPQFARANGAAAGSPRPWARTVTEPVQVVGFIRIPVSGAGPRCPIWVISEMSGSNLTRSTIPRCMVGAKPDPSLEEGAFIAEKTSSAGDAGALTITTGPSHTCPLLWTERLRFRVVAGSD